ncbi:hypothetical protein LWI29_028252 [Acer saccharum]|uniref:Uncharacterized protein n=1 Tax=Acer saccharum TaxID=4024 RepID=A0AA39SP43_ACESA|nr:hypothetical protein LWI29_028252 [Acer saccharum]
MEQLLSEVKSQLASSQKLCSLTKTQLKSLTESYKSLELHAEELDSEVKLLGEKTKELDNELLEEKHIHQDALARCKDLQDIVQRCKSCSIRSLSSGADSGIKTKQQEREIAAAAEKLAEDTPDCLCKHKKRTGLQFKNPPSNSRRKCRARRRSPISIPIVVLDLDEEQISKEPGRELQYGRVSAAELVQPGRELHV